MAAADLVVVKVRPWGAMRIPCSETGRELVTPCLSSHMFLFWHCLYKPQPE